MLGGYNFPVSKNNEVTLPAPLSDIPAENFFDLNIKPSRKYKMF